MEKLYKSLFNVVIARNEKVVELMVKFFPLCVQVLQIEMYS